MIYHKPEFQHECKNYKYPIYQIRPFDKDKFCIIRLNNYKDYAIYILGHDSDEFYVNFRPELLYISECHSIRAFNSKSEAKIAIDEIINSQKFMSNPDNFEFYPPIEIKSLSAR